MIMSQNQIGVMLSGSGHMDGSEIHEATLTLYFLDKLGANIQYFSLNQTQHHVVDHVTRDEGSGERNSLVESALIARGKIKPIEEADANTLDALILPGGLGAAKNLSNFALQGANMTVNDTLRQLIQSLHRQGKPQGFICIAPVIAANIVKGATVTIGTDPGTANVIEKMGASHEPHAVNEVCIDDTNNIISTPAYMTKDASISDIALGIEQLVSTVLKRVQENVRV